MDFTEWKNPWLKIFKQRGYKVTMQDRDEQYICMSGNNLILVFGSPDCEYPRIRSAIIADHKICYDKYWKCPVRVNMPHEPNEEAIARMFHALDYLREHADVANKTYGKNDFFTYDTYE